MTAPRPPGSEPQATTRILPPVHSTVIMAKLWKSPRGKLGFLQPLVGRWVATAQTPMGQLRCTRVFAPVLNGAYFQLQARWDFGGGGAAAAAIKANPAAAKYAGRPYEETAIFGVGDGGKVCFWSFTSDGKRSQGVQADAGDLHNEAIGFEAQMPAGLARMAYWPDEDGAGFYFVVESKVKKGWKQFVNHHYRAQP